ncbi:hypothetical protein D3C75_1003740 [compost metagenome]
MAEGVIHLFEIINIQHKHRAGLPRPYAGFQKTRPFGQNMPAVINLRQLVHHRRHLKHLNGGLQLFAGKVKILAQLLKLLGSGGKLVGRNAEVIIPLPDRACPTQ